MKKCKNCGKLNSDNVLFCSGCGSDAFDIQQTEEFSQDTRFDFTPTEIKGRVKAWQVILIALGCIALIAAGIFAVKSILSVKSYTKGEIVENVYTNEWAELRFVIDGDLKDVTADEAEYIENQYSEVGFVAYSESKNYSVSVLYYHLGNTSGYSEREGMDDLLLGYTEGFEELGVSPTISEYFSYSIADRDYTSARIEFEDIGTEYKCVRYEGEYAIIITAIAPTEEEVRSIISKFEHYEVE
ncbi:MAG: zinc-ribbon domain-containing protein [Clostridia bacterium]|nr:zinc-ribbon domain-containing protein [Clostridia bacterium]